MLDHQKILKRKGKKKLNTKSQDINILYSIYAYAKMEVQATSHKLEKREKEQRAFKLRNIL